MRIGIDAHIILAKHKRYDPQIARYTEKLITHLLEADKKQEHTWVLFFDQRMEGSKKLKKFEQDNVEIKHFPFVQYRRYLPVIYSHMLISSFLRSAHVDVFLSPEGLIPYLYPGKIVTTFHYVPKGESESNLFVRTFMMGARAAFAQLCKRAKRIVVSKRSDKDLLIEKHGAHKDQVVVMEIDDIKKVDWSNRVKNLIKLYKEVAKQTKKKKVRKSKKSKATKNKKRNKVSKNKKTTKKKKKKRITKKNKVKKKRRKKKK